jgi:CheY-like chemotaxis protein
MGSGYYNATDAAPTRSEAVRRRPRFLLVDDELIVTRTLVRLLRLERPAWDVSTARSVAEAVESLRRSRYDVLVTDLDMPGPNGIELLMHVALRYPDTIRVVHSARVAEMGGERVAQLADIVLTKPVEPERLVWVLDGSLGPSEPDSPAMGPACAAMRGR